MMRPSAVKLAPPHLRTAALLPLLFALDNGHALLVPRRMMMLGSVVERLAAVAKAVGAPVLVLEDLDTITTREPGFA